MATYEEILEQAKARLAEITATPKPSYSIDGQSVSWGEYLSQLQQTIRFCEEQIAAEGGAGELHMEGYS